MKKVLLTGATGFVGRHCLEPLHKKGYEIHAVYYSSKPVKTSFKTTWHRANLMDSKETARLVATVKPTHLLHLAWCATPGEYETSRENLGWVEASFELFSHFSERGGKRAVAVGTCMEAQALSASGTLYGQCKKTTGAFFLNWGRKTHTSAAWARLFHMYGPYEHPKRLIASTTRFLLQNKRVICKNGDFKRDFMHVEDVAAALVKLLDSPVEGIVNVASGEPVSLRHAVTLVAGKLGRLDKLTVKKSSPNAVTADVKRLRRELKWRPHYDLSRGLDQSISWWKKRIKK